MIKSAPTTEDCSTLALLASFGVYVQQSAPAPAAQAPPPAQAAVPTPAAVLSGSLSSSLGLYVFPAKKSDCAAAGNDETYCFGWAKTQTGIDPMNIKPQAPDQQTAANQADAAKQGARAAGAARGAAGGAIIGAIAGDAGT